MNTPGVLTTDAETIARLEARIAALEAQAARETRAKRHTATELRALAAPQPALALLDSLFANAPVGLAFVDADLRFVRINAALAEMNGRSVTDHLGRTLVEVVPQLADGLEPLYHQVLRTGLPIVDVPITGETPARPGVVRHWHASYYPVLGPDAAAIGVGVVVNETTAAWVAQQALRVSESNLPAIFDSSSQSIVLVDPDLCVVQWNNRADLSASAQFGYHFAVGVPIDRYMPPQIALERRGLLHRALQGEFISTKIDASLPNKPLWLQVDYNPISAADGAITGVCVTGLDITAQVHAEAALRAYAAEMHALSLRLVHAQEDERRAIAHELHDEVGQQLTGLNMVLQIGAAETAETVRDRLRTAQQMVNDLTSKVRQLSLDLRPSMLDDLGLLATLHWFIGRYQEQTQIIVEFRHHGCEQPIPPHTAIVVYRIVQEGLTNIARHAQTRTAAVQVWCSHGQLAVNIEDEGQGFVVETRGLGQSSLGLRGMRERVALLGGEFTVDSAPGEGARLFVTIPLDPAPTVPT